MISHLSYEVYENDRLEILLASYLYCKHSALSFSQEKIPPWSSDRTFWYWRIRESFNISMIYRKILDQWLSINVKDDQWRWWSRTIRRRSIKNYHHWWDLFIDRSRFVDQWKIIIITYNVHRDLVDYIGVG